MTEWRPIATAPKDATEILVWVERCGTMGPVVAHWAHGGGEDQPPFGPGWFINRGWGFAELEKKPTHWLPIPNGPGR